MYEDKTASIIHQQMIDNAPTNIITDQGEVFWDATRPSAIRFAMVYIDLDAFYDLVFPDTAVGDYLDKIGAVFNVSRESANSAIRSATFVGTTPNTGTKFFTEDGVNWTLQADGKVICGETGTIGNTQAVDDLLIPVESIRGLTSSTIGAIDVPGRDAQSDDDYRVEIIRTIKTPSINSNKAQIKEWCEDIGGVGIAKVQSLWNGLNTVKAILVGSDGLPATTSVIDAVQLAIDPKDKPGEGEGLADIGTVFTAVSATQLDITVSVRVALVVGKNLSDAQAEIERICKDYVKQLALSQATQLKYAELGARILNAQSITDYDDLLINGQAKNVVITEEQVAVIKTVTVTQ